MRPEEARHVRIGLRRRLRAAVAGVVAIALGSCASFGPGTVGRDRFDYDHAVTESWKRQLLLNLVKLRYGDTPMFLDVSSIINSYTLEGTVNAGSGWANGGGEDTLSLGGSAHYADRPTITYSPLIGERFVRSLLTPFPPAVVLSFIQSGWNADSVLRSLVTSINGINNRYGAGGTQARAADPDFYRLIDAVQVVQASGTMGMRLERTEKGEVTLLTLPRDDQAGEAAERARIIREILGIRKGLSEVRVVYGSGVRSDDEIAMITRSMIEVLTDISSGIDAPAVHVEEGRTYRSPVFPGDAPGRHVPPVRVLSGPEKPRDAFVAVRYRDHWFWVPDLDLRSKSFFSMLLILTSLTETGPAKGGPIVTVPAG